jgi:DNA-binding NarL/FixJ family response regulator
MTALDPHPDPIGAPAGTDPDGRPTRDSETLSGMRVVVADDSVLLREGMVRLLAEVGCEVVDAVDDAPSLVESAAHHRPDVAVVDIRMPPSNTDDGLRAAVEARAADPNLGVLMLSAYIELSYADVLLSDGRGGVGYLLKDRVTSLDTLGDALHSIAGGGTVLDPEVVAQLLVARRKQDPLGRLTPREREVLALMAEGRSNSAIAEQLVVTGGAVEKHVSNIFTKIDLPDIGSDNRRVLAVLAWLKAR